MPETITIELSQEELTLALEAIDLIVRNGGMANALKLQPLWQKFSLAIETSQKAPEKASKKTKL